MNRMRLLWRMYLSFLASALLVLAATAWYANHALRRFHEAQVAGDLEVRAGLLARELASLAPETDGALIEQRCREFGRLTQTRATVVGLDGRVIGDSAGEASRMTGHAARPEIAAALAGQAGRAVRFSDTMNRTLMYLAIPVKRDNAVWGVVRVSVPLSLIDWNLHSVIRQIALGAVLAAACFALVAFVLTRRITRPLEDMRRTAERLARGDLRARAATPSGGELASMARALNQMAAQLSERMEVITRRTEEQKAVFSSMAEGVLAVDPEGRILDLNPAAEHVLGVTAPTACGRSMEEAVRNPELLQFVARTLAAPGPEEGELVLHGRDERFLQVHGTSLVDARGRRLGALVVLNDITRLKRLETVRQDFVANVSHELKTPVTALRGCVETLSAPDPLPPDQRARFVAMMARQVERLGRMVDDLLSLARIEHDAASRPVERETGAVGDVLHRVVQAFEPAAAAQDIALVCDCPAGLRAPFHAALLEQAVGNLVDNALKYGGPGTRVEVRGVEDGPAVEIRVTDQGPGIEPRHQARIFERFYRVDPARSRALGGTGLGLAIVKHIALAHGGTVAVESRPGRGSTFTIRIPRG